MSQLKPIIPRLTSPRGIDRIIDQLQVELGRLPWLDRVFSRAMPYQENRDGSWVSIPKVLEEKGQYVSVLPNDRFKGMSFFQTDGPERPVANTRQLERPISLIVWVCLNKINHPKAVLEENYTADLIESTRANFRRSEYVESVGPVYDNDAREVYENYTLTEEQTHYMSYPYAGFRMQLVVRYSDVSGC